MTRSLRIPMLFCASLLSLAACKDTKAPAPETPAAPAAPVAAAASAVSTDQQRMGYALGVSVGTQFRNDKLDIDGEAMVQGMRDAYTGAQLALSEEQVKTAMQQLQKTHGERMQAEQQTMKAEQDKLGESNLAEGAAFLAKNKTAEGVTTTASGLQYKVLTAGTGPKPGAEETVKVHYRGTLLDGSEFDSSYARGEPVSFPVSGVIPGWVEALQLMPTGSKWTLYVPSDLAYGPGGAGGQIGPNAMLVFDVELLEIVPVEVPSAASSEKP